MQEVYVKLRLELSSQMDDNGNPMPMPTMDEICEELKRLLTIGEEGSGKEPSFGVRDITPM